MFKKKNKPLTTEYVLCKYMYYVLVTNDDVLYGLSDAFD